jgi:hypothetical protein
MVKLFKERVAREPEKTCYYFEDRKWTVADVSKNKRIIFYAKKKRWSPQTETIDLVFTLFLLAVNITEHPGWHGISKGLVATVHTVIELYKILCIDFRSL